MVGSLRSGNSGAELAPKARPGKGTKIITDSLNPCEGNSKEHGAIASTKLEPAAEESPLFTPPDKTEDLPESPGNGGQGAETPNSPALVMDRSDPRSDQDPLVTLEAVEKTGKEGRKTRNTETISAFQELLGRRSDGDRPLFNGEVVEALGKLEDVREWAEMLLNQEQNSPSEAYPGGRGLEPVLVREMEDTLVKMGSLEIDETLTHENVAGITALIGKILGKQGGAGLKALFQFAKTSRSSYIELNQDPSNLENDDRLIVELRAAVELARKLNTNERETTESLDLRQVIRGQARAAMTCAWSIITALALPLEERGRAVLEARWNMIHEHTERFAWLATQILGVNFNLILRLKAWLADANGPRISKNSLQDRLIRLRGILLPQSSAEMQNKEAYVQMGLQDIDAAEFAGWAEAIPDTKTTPLADFLPDTRSGERSEDKLESELEEYVPALKKKKSSGYVDRMIDEIMENEQNALNDFMIE
ncbi:unnamed protein product [Oikopleura dioica]|uniref:Uncharacterized protein n=1 Tax=Oikopleura dioica TaxID=34765 RepID=E4XM36_OIKDI|nr:unnamed protein product [Oikopleura dioica]